MKDLTGAHVALSYTVLLNFLILSLICSIKMILKCLNAGIVKELLARWPELCRQCDSTNTTPLYSAAVKDHLDVVNAILDVDEGSMQIVRKNGKTSLHMAARNGYLRIVKALIDRDPEIVSIIDKKGQTALHMAVKGKNTDVVEELLNAGPEILNIHDKKGNTALHIATRKWRPQVLPSFLLHLISIFPLYIGNTVLIKLNCTIS